MNRNRMIPVLLVSAAVLFVLEIVRPVYTADPLRNEMLRTILTRTVGGILFLLLIRENDGQVFGMTRDRRSLLCLLPATAAAVNNFPIIGLFTGAAQVTAAPIDLLLLAFQSLSVGLFEEMTFRGFLFPLVLQKFRGRPPFFRSSHPPRCSPPSIWSIFLTVCLRRPSFFRRAIPSSSAGCARSSC